MKDEFRKLEAKDVGRLLPYFARRSNLTCDSVIFDSYLWQDYFNLEYMIWEDRAVFFRMKEDGKVFAPLPVCDAETLPEAFRAQEDLFASQGIPFRVCWADEAGLAILNLDPDRYQITEEIGLADYIYDAEKLRTLSGKKYHKKKNHLNAFLKEYEGRWEYRRLHRWSRTQIWNFLEEWEKGKTDNVEEHLEAEMTGLHHYLFNMEVFDAVMSGIYIDGKLEAITIGSYNHYDRMSVVHVEKANREIRGLYTLINQQFQVHEFPDALLVNREDDVGLPWLRRAKESYHPVQMARKYEIVYAEDPEKRRKMRDARELWEEVFPEDSASFLDYYDQEKASANTIQTRYEDGKLVSMIQWNPYTLSFLGKEFPSRYLIAVATRKEYRHRGFMAGLLKSGLAACRAEGIPLVFLMPADPAIYRPFGFRYIYSQAELTSVPETGGQREEKVEITVTPLAAEDYPEAAGWLQERLSSEFDLFCRKDTETLRVAQAECASEGGGLCEIRAGKRIGLFSWWQEEVTVIRDLVLNPAWENGERLEEIWRALLRILPVRGSLRVCTAGFAGEKKPVIMGRITSLKIFLEAFRSREERTVILSVRDSILEENDGVFCWKLGPGGSTLEKSTSAPDVEADIADLLEWLAARQPGAELPDCIRELPFLRKGTYFPEIV